MQRNDLAPVDWRDDTVPSRPRARLLAGSAGLVALTLSAPALTATVGPLETDQLAATEVHTTAPVTTAALSTAREAVPARQRAAEPKAVAVVAPPTTTTTIAPPPTTEAPPPPEAAPAPAADPEPVVTAPPPAPTPPPAPPAPRPTPPPPPPPAGSVSANLDAIARCESGGNPDAYNPAGYYGAFQFSLPTWRGLGMTGDPRDYTYNEQKYVALALYNQRGYAPWPHCARSLGLL